MLNKTLTEILRTFSVKDMTRFSDMLNSPYFNKKQSLIIFWNELSKYHPEFKAEKEVIYRKVFHGKKYNYGTMKNLIHELTVAAEKFIEYEFYSKREYLKSENTLNGLLQRDLGQLFKKRFKKASELLEKCRGENEYHFKKYLLEVLRQNYMLSNDKYYGKYKDSIGTFTHLTLAYFIDLFTNHYNTAIMKSELDDAEYSLDFIKEALEFYNSAKIAKDFITEIYYNSFMLAYKGEEKNFYALKQLLLDNSTLLNKEQKYNFHVALSNFCVKMINSGNNKYKKEHFGIYKHMIENKIYSIDIIDKMEGNFYKKATGAAAAVKEFEWAKKFIENYKTKLDGKAAENYYNHALVELHINMQDWDNAAKSLARIKHTNSVDKMNLKRWQMIIFYEQGSHEELRYLIDSSRHFLSKDKILSPSSKERLKLFTELVNKLASIASIDDKKEKIRKAKELADEINEINVNYKEWFLEKVKLLEAGVI